MPRRHVPPRDAVTAVLAPAAPITGVPEAHRDHGMQYAFDPTPDAPPVSERTSSFMKRHSMGTCDECGNPYDQSFTIERNDVTHVFDSFECAVLHLLAPVCTHCGCRIIVGQEIEVEEAIFCCIRCATESSMRDTRERM